MKRGRRDTVSRMMMDGGYRLFANSFFPSIATRDTNRPRRVHAGTRIWTGHEWRVFAGRQRPIPFRSVDESYALRNPRCNSWSRGRTIDIFSYIPCRSTHCILTVRRRSGVLANISRAWIDLLPNKAARGIFLWIIRVFERYFLR